MRINKYVAASSPLSRRAADDAIAHGRVTINGSPADQGQDVGESDHVTLDGKPIELAQKHTTILFHKPTGYVVSREGQGSRTIYELLAPEYHRLNPVGRLDKDSSGLLLLTDDGVLANDLTHPSQKKMKLYEVTLSTPLAPLHRQMISDHGLQLEDGLSKLQLDRMHEGDDRAWFVQMHEGRNRQIRRTFNSLGYTIRILHRTQFGPYSLYRLAPGSSTEV